MKFTVCTAKKQKLKNIHNTATVVTESAKAYQVVWSEHSVEQLTTTLCCPVILSAKAHNYLQYKKSITFSWREKGNL